MSDVRQGSVASPLSSPGIAPLPDSLISGSHSAAELLEAGVNRRELNGPYWCRLDRDRYVFDTGRPSPIERVRRASALVPDGGALGGWAAALVHGADLDGETAGRTAMPVLVCAGRDQRVRRHQDCAVWRSELAAEDLVEASGIIVTSALRTAFDAARLDPHTGAPGHGRRSVTEAVVVLDALIATGCLGDDAQATFEGYLAERRRRAGVAQARQVAEHCDGRVRSAQESRLRMLWMIEAGLPRPEVNRRLVCPDGEFLAEVDLLDVEAGLVAEYDGAVHSGAERRSADSRRAERLRAANLTVVRLTSVDLSVHRQATIGRLAAKRREGLARDRRRDRWMLESAPAPDDRWRPRPS